MCFVQRLLVALLSRLDKRVVLVLLPRRSNKNKYIPLNITGGRYPMDLHDKPGGIGFDSRTLMIGSGPYLRD